MWGWRGRHNRLGFAYLVALVRVLGRWKNVILYGEIEIDPAMLKMRDPYRVFLHESGQYPKLHLGLDLASGVIVCANLAHDDVGDSTALPGLLGQPDGPVTGFLADGAYDGGLHGIC